MGNDKISAVGTNIAEKATMIWNVADMLRGPFKPHEFKNFIQIFNKEVWQRGFSKAYLEFSGDFI